MDKSGIRHGLKAATVILLLAVYIAGNASYGLFHQLFHGHESFISHSPDLEKDPCHRVIHHFEKDNVCKHDSHFAVNETYCQCDILCNPDQMTVLDPSRESVQPDTIIAVIITFAHVGEISLYHPSRAPPLA